MSLRDADLRFLLPEPPRTAWVAPSLPAVRRGFEELGPVASAAPDVGLARADDAEVHPGRVGTVVLGRGGRARAAAHARVVRRFVALPGLDRPELVVPVDRANVAGYVLQTWALPRSRGRRARNRVTPLVVRAGAMPDVARSVSVGLAADVSPFLVRAATAFGVPESTDWFLTLGTGDALTRGTFQVFASGAPEPGWVVKFSRVAGHAEQFDRDERGVRLAREAGGAAARRCPDLLGRFEVAGMTASVERAALGERVMYALRRHGPRRDKLALVEAVAAWAVDVARDTRTHPGALEEERRRLTAEVVPRWSDRGVPADLAERLPPVPAVLQHNDLGTWNIIARGLDFTVVDWESARPRGLPLWDLLYFLVDALVRLHTDGPTRERAAYAARLLRGEADESPIVARWVRGLVEALGIPADAVAPVVTLGWLHHGLSSGARASAASALAPGITQPEIYADWIAEVWMTTPGLGLEWRAWR